MDCAPPNNHDLWHRAPLSDDGVQHRSVGGDVGARTGHQISPAQCGAGRWVKALGRVVNSQAGGGGTVSASKCWGASGPTTGSKAGDAGHAHVDGAGVRGLGVDRGDGQANSDCGEQGAQFHGIPPCLAMNVLSEGI